MTRAKNAVDISELPRHTRRKTVTKAISGRTVLAVGRPSCMSRADTVSRAITVTPMLPALPCLSCSACRWIDRQPMSIEMRALGPAHHAERRRGRQQRKHGKMRDPNGTSDNLTAKGTGNAISASGALSCESRRSAVLSRPSAPAVTIRPFL